MARKYAVLVLAGASLSLWAKSAAGRPERITMQPGEQRDVEFLVEKPEEDAFLAGLVKDRSIMIGQPGRMLQPDKPAGSGDSGEDVDRLNSTLAAMTIDLGNARKAVEEAGDKFDAQAKELADAERDADTAEKALAEAKTEISDLKTKLAAVEAKLAAKPAR